MTGGGGAAGAPIRVLVVEDSVRLRARIVGVLEAQEGIVVVGQAADGRAAVERCLELRPDVVTMDVRLPVLTGLAATEQLMQRCPTPILIISAATDRRELVNTFAALAAGAVDVLEKPGAGDAPDADWDHRLAAAVRIVARIRVITHFGHTTPPAPARPRTVPAPAPSPEPVRPEPPLRHPGLALPSSSGVDAGGRSFSVVAIGASTGGPAAVAAVLSELPVTFSLPVLLVLHVSETFGPAIAKWLSGMSGRPVRLAEAGESLSAVAGEVVMAPPGQHMALRAGQLTLNHDAERHSCRPSVDVLFESLAAEAGARTVACLLTGMGRDGASGLLDVRRSGGLTIAQDEATSVVYGMPGEAVRLGAAQHVLPIEAIGPALGRFSGSLVGP